MIITYPEIVGNDEIYMDCLEAIVGDKRDSMIDLCAHHAAHTPMLKFKQRKYVDILPNELYNKDEQQYFVQADALDTPLDIKYDTAFCLDGVEHFTKANGYRLLNIMETISGRQILFTPLGEMWVENSGHPEEHASGWKPEDVSGYACIVFPDYHKGWGFGAFFFWKCENIEQDFERVKNTLNQYTWSQQNK